MDEVARPSASPLLVVYAAAQERSPGHLALYRVGEFYEVLGSGALVTSRALGIQLTRRRQKNADDVPMCGIPAGTSEQAIGRLLAAGHKVAVSEQPTSSGAERPFQVLTPATSVDPEVVEGGRANNLGVYFVIRGMTNIHDGIELRPRRVRVAKAEAVEFVETSALPTMTPTGESLETPPQLT